MFKNPDLRSKYGRELLVFCTYTNRYARLLFPFRSLRELLRTASVIFKFLF